MGRHSLGSVLPLARPEAPTATQSLTNAWVGLSDHLEDPRSFWAIRDAVHELHGHLETDVQKLAVAILLDEISIALERTESHETILPGTRVTP